MKNKNKCGYMIWMIGERKDHMNPLQPWVVLHQYVTIEVTNVCNKTLWHITYLVNGFNQQIKIKK